MFSKRRFFTATKVLGFCVASVFSLAQAAEFPELLETFEDRGQNVPYVYSALSDSPKYVVILFTGGDGIVNPRLVNGKIRYRKRANFLVRSRPLWVNGDYAGVLLDTSADLLRFENLVKDLRARHPGASIYLVGTSRGTAATLDLARRADGLIEGFVHTSSLRQISEFDARGLKSRQLIVHHRDDACPKTPFFSAVEAARKNSIELVEISGGKTEGPACEPLAHHGFYGNEQEVVQAIKSWIEERSK